MKQRETPTNEQARGSIAMDYSYTTYQHRGKTYAHALTLALPVCTCGSVARINLVVTLAVCQLVVVNQQPQIKEKRTTITKKGM